MLSGEIAALFTSFCFAGTATFFTLAGEKVGSVVLNRTRLILAVILLSITHFLVLGTFWPQGADSSRWLWLGLSGVIGLALGDAFLFQAYLWIGPRLTMLMMSLAPVMVTVLAWLIFDEQLTVGQLVGIVITLTGVSWVVLEKHQSNGREQPRDYVKGILFGLGAATGQALGLLLAKPGLGGNFSALSGNMMRMLAATAAMWIFTILRGQALPTLNTLRANRPAWKFLLGGSIVGPFLGVWSSLYAIQHAFVGIASTLMALPPVILLPISWVVFKERFGWQAVAGTLVTIGGVAILFLV